MKQKRISIGIFASSDSLRQRVMDIIKDMDDSFRISDKGLDRAVPEGRSMEEGGVEAIISRRGTAHLLRKHLSIPVVSLPQSSIDLIVCLKKASKIGKRILLPSFGNISTGIDTLSGILDIELFQDVYKDEASLSDVVSWGKKAGCTVVLGGNVTRQIAERFGLKFVEITSSPEDIYTAIENAKSVAISNRKQKALASHYQGILDASSDGIVAVDETGRISAVNKAAKRIFKTGDRDPGGESVFRYIEKKRFKRVLTEGIPTYDRMEEIAGRRYLVSQIPVSSRNEIIGAIYTLREISGVIKAENAVRRVLSKGLVSKYSFDDLVFSSSKMYDIIEAGRQFAKTDSTILVIGETGTGKEVLAHSIHSSSPRSQRPFVSVNCAALPEQLLESELFGYEEGSFTGSRKGGKAGRFELSHKGTIFLDEIDTTPHKVQIRLLRILQEREVMRIGADRKIPIDVRVIAASARDLKSAVEDGTFRNDLFFRLNVLRILIPPLRDRPEDIPVLLEYFIHQIAKKHKLQTVELPPPLLEKLLQYHWPGNVRQLKNFAERLVLTCNLNLKNQNAESLVEELVTTGTRKPEVSVTPKNLKALAEAKKKNTEKELIKKTLASCRWNRSMAARKLGISRTTLWRKIKLLKIGEP